MDPHLRDLRYFVAVAEELHFTQAAQRLHIAQPTLSRQIRQLEQHLGLTLLDRDQRTVALTAAGKELLDGARQVLALWDDIDEGLHHAGETVRIGVQTAVGRGLLAELESASGQSLEVYSAPWNDPSAGLAGRHADVALLWLPVPDPTRYRWTVLRTEQRWVLMPETHPMAEREEIAFADIVDQPFIALPPESGPAREFWLAGATTVGATAATAEEKLEAIGLGMGICLIAADNVPMYRWPGIVARPVTGLTPAELALVWRSNDRRASVRKFVTIARQ